MKGKVLIISGGVGVGKLPLIKELELHYGFQEVKPEPRNPQLFDLFLSNPETYGYLHHMQEVIRTMKAENEALSISCRNNGLLVLSSSFRDVIWSHIKTWHLFYEDTTTDYDWDTWDSLGEELLKLFPHPFLAVNLTCKSTVMWERVKSNDPKFAQLLDNRDIEKGYLKIFESFRIDGFLKSFPNGNTLTIDVSNLDLYQDPKALAQIAARINERMLPEKKFKGG